MIAANPTRPFTLLALSTVEMSFEGALTSISVSISDLRAFCVSVFSSPNVDALDAASSISPLFATLTENTRGGGYILQTKCPLLPAVAVGPHQSQVTKSFTIRTYTKHTHNSSRMNTSKTQHLKSFRMNTYKKTGEGSPSLIFSARLCDLCVSAL